MNESKHTSANSTNDYVVTTSEVVGDGEEARRMVRVGPWDFTAWVGRGEGEEPRIRDIDLGMRLGYERPRKVRDLIKELPRDADFRPEEVCPRPGQTGGRPATEFWLNEAEALFVATQSRTPVARALTMEMIRVFMLARRGLLPGQSPPSFDPAMLVGIIGPLVREVVEAVMAERPTPGLDLAGKHGARDIRAKLKEYGRLMAVDGSARERKRWRSRGETELRAYVNFTGKGSRWDALPRADYLKALRHLEAMIDMAEKNAAARGVHGGVHQGDLFGKRAPAQA